MKLRYKFIALTTAASMAALAFTGCGGQKDDVQQSSGSVQDITAAEAASGAAEVLESASSVNSQVSVELSGTFSYEDEAAEMSTSIVCDIESVLDPAASHVVETITSAYIDTSYEQSVESYTVDEDGTHYTYSGSGDMWTKTETGDVEAQDNTGTIFHEIADGNLDAALSGSTEKFNGRDVYILNVDVLGDHLDSIIDFSFDDQSDIFGNIDYSDMSMDTTLYVYTDTLEPAYITVSCDELGNAMFEQMLASSDVDFTVDSFNIQCTYNSFNDVDDITVPEEVKTAAENPSDTSSESSDPDGSGNASSEIADVESSINNADDIVYDPATGELDLDFTFFDGDSEYALPVSYTAFTDSGWAIDDSSSGMVYANDYALEYMHKGDSTITVYIYNSDSSDREYSECSVIGMDVTSSDLGSMQAALPSGISLSSSTLDDVLAAYGKPTTHYVDETMVYVDYMSDDMSQTLCLYFDPATQVLNEIDIQYWPV